MQRLATWGLAACLGASVGGCAESAPVSAVVAAPAAVTVPAPAAIATPTLSGERLTYVVGCVHCHHQLPKPIMNAPSLLIAQTYSLPEFRTLLKTGVTRDARDLYALHSAMGFTAREQLSYLTDDEVAAIHQFLHEGWNAERAAIEDAKAPPMPPPPGPSA